MSEPRERMIYTQLGLTKKNKTFLKREAAKRDPRRYNAPGGTRAQSSVARDVFDFAETYYILFSAFVAMRGIDTTSGND